MGTAHNQTEQQHQKAHAISAGQSEALKTALPGFTPGPWFLRNADQYPELPHAWVVEGADGRHVATFPCLVEEARERQASDASLIAAAPEMFAALQALSDALPSDEYMRAEGSVPGPGLVAMREALAKAKGGLEPKLWAVHVQGPDDIVAVKDRAAADTMAKATNDWYANRKDQTSDDPVIHAVVIEYEGTPEDHAENLSRQAALGKYA